MTDSGYIGSKLSLISKSDIRYVGILQNVDTQTSSITLGQVQSFGTEGRRGGRFQDEIPPSVSIFEYIVFRGADVKDLQVFEAPPPPPPAGAGRQVYALPQYATQHPYFYHHTMPPTSYTYPMTNQAYSLYSPPPLTIPSTTTMTMIAQKPDATDDVTPTPTFSPTELVPDTMTKVKTPLVDDVTSHLTISKPDAKDSPNPSPRTTPDTLVTAFNTELDGVTKVIDELAIGDKGQLPRDETAMENDIQKLAEKNDKLNNKLNNKKNTSSGNRNIKRKSKSKKAAKHPMLEQEFDFASSNAKFNKDTSQTDNSSLDAFYDKKKSFFDNISCETKEKTEPCLIIKDYQKKHRNEKQLNLETFGPSSMPRRKQARQGGRTNVGLNNSKQAATAW